MKNNIYYDRIMSIFYYYANKNITIYHFLFFDFKITD